MTSYVLTFLCDEDNPAPMTPETAAALSVELVNANPGWTVRPGVLNFFELQCEDDIDSALTKLGSRWGIRPMSYAETNVPGVSLKGLRERLAQLREQHHPTQISPDSKD